MRRPERWTLGLRDRVTLASAAVLAIGALLLTVGVSQLLSNQLERDVAATLSERADAQLATLDLRGRHIVVRDARHDEALDHQAWVYEGGRALQRATAPAAVQRAADALATVARTQERKVGEDVRLRAEPAYADAGHRRLGTVVVGVSLLAYEHTERLALFGMLALDLFVLAVGTLLVRRAVGNALGPVAEMTRAAADWSEHDLDRRFDLGPPRDELTGLSATLDSLLARIAASLRHEQRFSAEMAHELRTPLSGVRGEAELALRPGRTPQEQREALEQVLRGTDRMQGVIDTLLAAARSDAGNGAGRADAVAAARAALDAVEGTAERAGVRAELVAGPGTLRVGAEADLVVQALHPLLDNAIRHASELVRVSATREDGHIVLRVRDDGPGPAPDALAQLFEPGGSASGGAGLGLPLARRLARTSGGDVVAEPGGAGGSFALRLPALS
jgi:signal transduction histidine kinase